MAEREGRRFVVTTVIRDAPLGEVSGRVYVVDADAGRVLGSAPIPETPWAPMGTNPRGGHRGGRGVATVDGKLVLANSDEIHVYDRTWRAADVLTNPLLGDVHEVVPDEDGLWVCATRADSLLRLGWDGSVRRRWTWRDDPGLVDHFGYRDVAPIDDSIDFRDMRQVNVAAVDISHLNSVLPCDDGLLVSLGRVRFPSPSRRQRVQAALGAAAQASVVGRPLVRRLRRDRIESWGADPQPGTDRHGIVVRLRAESPAEILLDRRLVDCPNHNLSLRDRELVFCETSRERLVGVHLETGAERTVDVPGASRFVRALARLRDDRFLVGSLGPSKLQTVDLATGYADAGLVLSHHEHEAVHDIAPLPDEWDDLPVALGR